MAFSPETYALLKGQGGGGGGSESSVFVIEIIYGDEVALDKTWNEIKNAFQSGKLCFIHNYYQDEIGTFGGLNTVNTLFGEEGVEYTVSCFDGPNYITYRANTANDYPVAVD